MSSNIIIYSAVTSSYDMVFKPKIRTENVQYILFSDDPKKIKGWDVRPITNTAKMGGLLTNRWYKFFPHEVFKEAEYSIYVDGNIRIIGDLGLLIQEFKESRAALGVFRHPDRTNIIDEADACIEFGKFDDRDKKLVKDQLKVYSELGLPLDQKLTDNGVIFRWHKHPKLPGAMSLCWEQLQSFTKRDQISLPYVVWENNLLVKKWDWSIREKNEYFEDYHHRGLLIRNLRIIVHVYRNEYVWSKFIYWLTSYVRRLSNNIKN